MLQKEHVDFNFWKEKVRLGRSNYGRGDTGVVAYIHKECIWYTPSTKEFARRKDPDCAGLVVARICGQWRTFNKFIFYTPHNVWTVGTNNNNNNNNNMTGYADGQMIMLVIYDVGIWIRSNH